MPSLPPNVPFRPISVRENTLSSFTVPWRPNNPRSAVRYLSSAGATGPSLSRSSLTGDKCPIFSSPPCPSIRRLRPSLRYARPLPLSCPTSPSVMPDLIGHLIAPGLSHRLPRPDRGFLFGGTGVFRNTLFSKMTADNIYSSGTDVVTHWKTELKRTLSILLSCRPFSVATSYFCRKKRHEHVLQLD